MSKNLVVSIIGGTIWGNRGAESMLVTTIGMIREKFPNAKFNVFSYVPSKDCQLVNDKNITILSGKPVSLVTRHFFGALIAGLLKVLKINIPKSNFFKIARALNESNLLLDIGGISFSDGREKFLPYNALILWPSMLLGVPVIKIAQAMGPFKNPFNHIFAKLSIPRCKHIFARGEQTAEHLKELGIPQDKWEIATDIAFLYKPTYSLSIENKQKVDLLLAKLKDLKKQKKEIIVITPSILVETESEKKGLDYKAKLFEIVKFFQKGNAHFVFLPNATREGSEKIANNDLLTFQRMQLAAKDIFDESNIGANFDWVTYDVNTASIREILSFADWLFTSRYHSMISALCLGVNLVVIGWGHKYKETMDYFELGNCCLDFNDEHLNLGTYLSAIVKEEENIKQLLKKNKNAVVESAQKQREYIIDFLS